MKKLISVLAFLTITFPAFSTPWGLLSQAESIPEAMFPLSKYAKGQTITYCVDDYFGAQPSQTLPNVQKVFSQWPAAVSSFITASGRAEEFKDILALTSKPISLKQVECGRVPEVLFKDENAPIFKQDKRTSISKEDIRIVYIAQNEFKKSCGSETAKGCFVAGLKDSDGATIVPAYILVQADSDAEVTLKHEIGHAFGLSDQYLSGRINSSPKYGTSKVYPSIMFDAPDITCDDAEGFINALDCLAFNKSRGGKEGWASICPQSEEVYVNCSAKNREAFINIDRKMQEVSISKYNDDGSLISTERYPAFGAAVKNVLFSPRKSFSEVKRDKQGRITSLKDKDGNESLFDYTREGRLRIFSKKKIEGQTVVDAYSFVKPDTKIKGFGAFIATNYHGGASTETSIYRDKEASITVVDLEVTIKGPSSEKPFNYILAYTFYNKKDGFVLRRETSDNREYSTILNLDDFYFVVNCSVSGKSKIAECYAGGVSFSGTKAVPQTLGDADKGLMLDIITDRERILAIDDTLAIQIKEGKNHKKGNKALLSAYSAFKEYKDFGNNFADNLPWVMDANVDQEKEKKDKLIEELNNLDKQRSASVSERQAKF